MLVECQMPTFLSRVLHGRRAAECKACFDKLTEVCNAYGFLRLNENSEIDASGRILDFGKVR